jgi:hypothetical protein
MMWCLLYILVGDRRKPTYITSRSGAICRGVVPARFFHRVDRASAAVG